MHRRHFGTLVGAFTIASALPLQVTGQSLAAVTRWLRFAEKVSDYYDNATEAIDWFFWMQEADIAVAANQMPPPPPVGWGVFSDMLEEEQEKIRQLAIPAYEAPLPSLSVPTGGGFDATRSDLRARVMMLEECGYELATSIEAIKYLEMLHSALDRQAENFRRLGDLLERWSTLPLGPFIMEQLALESINTIFYVETINTTAGILQSKIDQAGAGLKGRRADLGRVGREIVNLLVVEAVDLKVEVDRLTRLDQEVADLGAKMREALEARAKASSDVRDQEVYVEAARLDVTQAEDELASARDELAALNARRPDVVRGLNEPFRCPNGKPWAECDHYDLKDQYIKRQNDLSDQLRQIDRRMSDLRSSIPVYEGDLERAERNLETARNHLRDLRQVLRTAEADHAEAVRVYNEREQFTREEKWRSRADVFLPENASDEGRVKAIIQQAGA